MSRSASRRARGREEKDRRKLDKEPVELLFEYPPAALAYGGPMITTDLTITDAHRAALEKAGEAIPPRVQCRFLIDTGADGSVVKHEFAERTGLKLINDNVPLHGVGIDTTGKSYIGRIQFGMPSRIVKGAVHQMAIDIEIMSARLEGDAIDGLIGRDVLRFFRLSYDGKTGVVKMLYYKPE